MPTEARRVAVRKYYLKNKEKILAKALARDRKNPERRRRAARLYARRHPDRVRARNIRYRERNRDKMNAASNKWSSENRDHVNKRIREQHAADPNKRMTHAYRSRILSALKTGKKSTNATKLLGCSIEDFRIYLESKFEPGMSWANYGAYWEIDHIMPCAIFDLTKPEHQRRCFHFSNHQPLTLRQNRSNSAKVLTNQFQLL